MIKKTISLFVLLLSACSHHRIMTMDCYASISLGMSKTELVEIYGSPYSTCQRNNGVIEYTYIERLNLGNTTMQERTYYILVQNDKVVAKRYTTETPPNYMKNSYFYQTAQGDEESID